MSNSPQTITVDSPALPPLRIPIGGVILEVQLPQALIAFIDARIQASLEGLAPMTEVITTQNDLATLKAAVGDLPNTVANNRLDQEQINATLMLKDGSNSTIGGGLGLTSNDGVVEVVPIPPEA